MGRPLAFGVRIDSEFAFDLLPQVEAGGPSLGFEVRRVARLQPASATAARNGYLAQGRELTVTAEAAGLTVTVAGEIGFALDLEARAVCCRALPGVAEETIRYWFLQQVLPIFLLFDGSTEMLHATAVATQAGAVAFLGRSGIGKSTLLNHLLGRGMGLMTDEHLALARADYACAVPSIPFYRPYRSLEDLGLYCDRFCHAPLRLARVYVLEAAAADARVEACALDGAEMVDAVMRNQQYNLFSPQWPPTLELLRRRFRGLASLARRVPVARLRVPRSLDRLAEVGAFVERQLEEAA